MPKYISLCFYFNAVFLQILSFRCFLCEFLRDKFLLCKTIYVVWVGLGFSFCYTLNCFLASLNLKG